jgi:hypothetical protein
MNRLPIVRGRSFVVSQSYNGENAEFLRGKYVTVNKPQARIDNYGYLVTFSSSTENETIWECAVTDDGCFVGVAHVPGKYLE